MQSLVSEAKIFTLAFNISQIQKITHCGFELAGAEGTIKGVIEFGHKYGAIGCGKDIVVILTIFNDLFQKFCMKHKNAPFVILSLESLYFEYTAVGEKRQ